MSALVIFKKEITENILTLRNVITTILCLFLLLTSIILLYNDYKDRLTNYNLRDTKGQYYFGSRFKLAKKPTPLSTIVRGLDPDMGRLIVVWQGLINRPGGDVIYPGEKNYLLSLFSVPDFAYVVKTVMSLLALFFTFDAVCGEKQRGTLRLMLANNVSRSAILLGKWLGGYVSFLMCVVPGVILMLLVVTLLPMVALDSESWLRTGVILGLALVYVSLFFLLGLFISTRVHRPETALILILLVWLVWVIGVPNVSPLIAKKLYPIPTAWDIKRQKSEIEGSQEDRYERYWRLNDEAVRMVRNQASLAQYLSRISPLGSFTAAITTMARTGVEDAHRYKAYVIHWDKQRREQEGLRFAPTEMRFEDSLSTVIVDLFLLILFNLVFFMGAYLSFMRYDVR